jgi:hypothetical protein
MEKKQGYHTGRIIIMALNKNSSIKLSILTAFFIVMSLSGCLSNWQGDLAKIVISFDGAERVVDNNANDTARLEHEVVLTNETETLNFNFKGNTIFEVYVAPGNWNVSVYSYLDGTIYASGSKDVILKSGKDNKEIITMHRANLAAKLDWLKDNAVDGGEYTVKVNSNEIIGSGNWLGYDDKKVTITMTGGGAVSLNDVDHDYLFNIGKNVTLILENITITIKSGLPTNHSPLVNVGVNGTLIMNDNSIITGNVSDGTRRPQRDYYYGGSGVFVGERGHFIMNGGTISNNKATERDVGGGGVFIWRGTFEMKGGTITNNKAGYGGGVCVSERGEFTMTKGDILNNSNILDPTTNGPGGGVYVGQEGKFSMKNGTISGNTANGGGGVFVDRGTFEIEGGTITGNKADYGGGVGVGGKGTFTMKATGKIDNNTAIYCGGGVDVSEGTFYMNGGDISNNKLSEGDGWTGGGVFVGGDGTFYMSGGKINNNEAIDHGGGVCVNGGTFTMNGGTISGNKAKSSGGGVFLHINGIFTKTGGTIYGYPSSNNNNSNKVQDDSSMPNKGHAVRVYLGDDEEERYRDDDVLNTDNLSYDGRTNEFSGTWD